MLRTDAKRVRQRLVEKRCARAAIQQEDLRRRTVHSDVDKDQIVVGLEGNSYRLRHGARYYLRICHQ
jgi:hypothetical protein